MKAYVRIDPNNQAVEMTEVPIPEINSDQVLIKVKAFGAGIHDRYFIPPNVNFPYVIGSEGAGVIEKLGSDVTDYKLGDRVIFTTVLQPQGGTWAEYAAANQSALISLPENLSFVVGAGLPIPGKTALECLRELNLSKNDTLFIAGASGAIGTILIQLAAAKGIRVSASASAKNHDYMKSLGAEKTVDYHDSNWKKEVQEWSEGGVTAALAIQPGTGIDSIKVVKDGGTIITVSGDNAQISPERNITIRQMGHDPSTQKKVVELLKSISNDDIKIEIENKYPFEKALDALKKTETRHARGKVIVLGKD